MAQCPNCKQEISDTAKFCRYCGSAVAPRQQQEAATKSCPNCHKDVALAAKFCRYCGFQFVGEEVETNNVDVTSNYVTWRILPGQLAVKIDERDIAGYGDIKGLYVAPGTKACIFVDGKYLASLESGKYPFKDIKPDSDTGKNGFVKFWHNIARFIKDGVAALFGRKNKPVYTIMLVRGEEFPLVFTVENVTTANIRSDVGLHMLCRIKSFDQFLTTQLADRQFVSLQQFSDVLYPAIYAALNVALGSTSPQNVQNDVQLQQAVVEALNAKLGTLYGYIEITRIVDLTASQQDMENIRRLKEELYVAEQELEQAQLRNDFLNRLQNSEYENELRTARSRVDYRALMDKIDEEGMLNDDKKEQFVLLLEAQKQLRTARTQAELDNAVDGLLKSRLLSRDEVESLQREIRHRGEKSEMQHNIDLQRMQDTYADERRAAEQEFEGKEMNRAMDMLRQMQEMKEQQAQAEHRREMEKAKQRTDADIEKYKISATMSFEQIMAANPDITPEAAAALAKKFEAEAAASQNSREAEMSRQHQQDLKDILAQQMAMTRDIIDAQNRANSRAVEDKQRELDRVNAASESHQDRMLAGMQTTLTAVAGMNVPQQSAVFCPNCGQANDPSATRCKKCGSALD